MAYQLSEKDMDTLGTFVPISVLKGLSEGQDKESIKLSIRENLLSSYKTAKRALPKQDTLDIKINDLYDVYKDTVNTFLSGDNIFHKHLLRTISLRNPTSIL